MIQAPNVEHLISVFLKCRKEKNISLALKWHAHAVEAGIDSMPILSNCLVATMADVGRTCLAQQCLDRLCCQSEYSWDSIISGYVKCGDPQLALSVYHKHEDRVSLHLDESTYIALLKVCSLQRDMETGYRLHCDIARRELLQCNMYIAGSLVDMHTKCGYLQTAEEVFFELPYRDTVLWTSLIAGYTEHWHGEEALECFDLMQLEGISPDSAMLVCGLKASVVAGRLDKVHDIHTETVKKGFIEKNDVLGSSMVDAYVKFGMLVEAEAVFLKLVSKDIVAWTALMSGYVEKGCCEEALNCYELMVLNGLSPTVVTYICCLKVSSSTGIKRTYHTLHSEIVSKGFDKVSTYIGCALLDLYIKRGSFVEAEYVFSNFMVKNIIAWNTLISGYLEQGYGEMALNCFERLHHESTSSDAVTLVCSLKAACSIQDIDSGRKIYSEITRKGLETDLIVGNSLIDFYCKCASLAEAQHVFENLPIQNAVSWTSLITGYCDFGHIQEAMHYYNYMKQEGFFPVSATFVSVLGVTSSLGSMRAGQEIHCEIVKAGVERELLIGNTLIDMYAKFHSLAEAQYVLGNQPTRDVVSWNALIAGYIVRGCHSEALESFEHMRLEVICPDSVTCMYMLKACCGAGSIKKGREIHSYLIKTSIASKCDSIGNSIVDMYVSFGLLEEAQKVFEEFLNQSTGSWNALISGYIEQDDGENALNCLQHMQKVGILIDSTSLVNGLKACASIGSAAHGQEIHSHIIKKGVDMEPLIGNTVVCMYAKCGLLTKAQLVFEKLSAQNLVSWTAIITGYAQKGDGKMVFECFRRMIEGGIEPDIVTFGTILNAFSHAGLLDMALLYFAMMKKEYGFIQSLEHYICIIDLLGRAGHVDEAFGLVNKMPIQPSIVVWHVILGACRKWQNVEMGQYAFEQALLLDKTDNSAYICMFNIYQDAGMIINAHVVESMRQKIATQKIG